MQTLKVGGVVIDENRKAFEAGLEEGSVAKLSTRYEINVQISESKIIRLKVDYANTVMQLKKIIFKKEKIPIDHQRLFLGEERLESNKTIHA